MELTAARFTLRTFGALALESDGERIAKFSTKKCALLLALVAVEKHQRIGRDRLAELLWPDDYLDMTRQRLRQELRRLRENVGSFGGYLRADRQWVEVEPDALVTDAQLFDDLIAESDGVEEPRVKAKLLEQAVSLLQGPFLTGYSDPWVTAMRRTYDERARQAWLSLADVHEACESPEAALAATMNAVRHDPLDSDANGTLIRRLFERGQEARARQAFFEFDAMMFREFGKHAPDSIRIPAGVASVEVRESAPAKENPPTARPAPVFGREDLLATIANVLSRRGSTALLVGTIGVGKRHILREAVWRFSEENSMPVQFGGPCESVADGLYVVEGVDDAATLAIAIEDAARKGWRVIADSRTRIRMEGVTEILVPPMETPSVGAPRAETLANPSVQLLLSQFSETAISKALPSEVASIAELARQLDGLPVALKAFAPRLILQNPAQILTALESSLRDFTEANFKMLPALLAELSDEARSGLLSLALLDGASAELAQQLATSDVWRELENRCLIVMREDAGVRRLRVPKPMAFAIRSQTDPISLAKAMRETFARLALFAFNMDYYLVGENQDYFFRCMESELTNLLSTIKWAIVNDPSIAAKLVYGTWRTLGARGNPSRDAELLYRGAAAAVGHEEDILMIARSWTGAGIALAIGGQLDLAEPAYLAGIEAFTAGGDMTGVGWVNLNYVGGVLIHTDPKRALEVAKLAAEQSGDSINRSLANAAYAYALAQNGQFSEAIRIAEQVFADRVSSDDPSAKGRAYGELAHIYQLAGRTEAARPLAIEGVRRLREVGVQDLLLEALIFRAELGLDVDDTAEILDEAEAIAQRMGSNSHLLDVARLRFRSASLKRDRVAMIQAIEKVFNSTQAASGDRELSKSLQLLATELDRSGKTEYANSILRALGADVEGASHAGWESLLSSDSKPTICVLAVVMAKEALGE